MFGMRASGAAASWVVGRMGTDAHLYDDPEDAAIPALLDSRFDGDKVDALKRLLALIAQGVDVAHLFPQVVKNVAAQSLEVKKLVYLYLLHYAETRQNEALLSINIFQKDLSDINPLVRAWALRTMAGIRLHVVAPLVLVAVKKCARDPSPYVRKCAAYALCKLYDLLPEENTTLEEIVDVLLGDSSFGVVGAATVAFKSVCPNCLALIAKHFRRLCETLPDIEEWYQITLIEILLRYVIAKHGLVKDSVMFAAELSLETQVGRDSVPVSNISSTQAETIVNGGSGTMPNIMLFRHYIEEYSGAFDRDDDKFSFPSVTTSTNDDVVILLKCTSPLLWSQNSAVILAAASVHWIMAPAEEVKRIVGPILFTLRSSPDATYVMLGNILVFAKTAPLLFASYYEDFFICASDPYQTRALKLEILTTIATESSIPAILEEFQDYIKDPNRRFVADTVAAIALCALKLPSITSSCLEGLLALVLYELSITNSVHLNEEDAVLVQAILSIKEIVKIDAASHEKVIIRLVRCLDTIMEPAARSLIIWIFGEYSSTGNLIPKIAPVVLKYLAWSFAAEVLETKLQILNASAKVIIHSAEERLEEFKRIVTYVIQLAACDMNYDVRDRARFLSGLLPCCANENDSSCRAQNVDVIKELADHIFGGKIPPASNSDSNYRIYLPGSLSQVVLHAAPGYAPLPKPQSMILIHKTVEPTRGMADSSEGTNSDAESGSSRDESGSVYDSESEAGSDSNDDGHNLHRQKENKEAPLIHMYDGNVDQDITIKSEEASGSKGGMDQTSEGSASIPTLVPVEEIQSLAPEQTAKMLLQVHFHHHLLPLKLSVLCNGKRHPAKLHPDIAYFVRPLPMDLNAFLCKENQLRGMFEYARRCTFKDHLQKHEQIEESTDHNTDKNLLVAQTLASKVLSNANVHLVSMDMPVTFSIDDASGLCWRFSSEILSTSNPCLITVVADGHTSEPLDLTVKVNSEDTAFGLNLLNRVVAIIE
ncbi:unnamed protein product [Triticum turgidum subsp. durum]|uniref:AP-3 complex subunit beta n=1 Tax=Triticum turgidum subsp. durum TaxID=4567 RepID=A0A9R0S291_TRITD|nr:unnamed protein product [Triticum turgidum subsp. durum]